MAQAQEQPMAAQPAAKPAIQPAATPAAKPADQKPVAQGTPGQPNTPPQQSGWMKWLLIVLGILLVVGGLSYWILAP